MFLPRQYHPIIEIEVNALLLLTIDLTLEMKSFFSYRHCADRGSPLLELWQNRIFLADASIESGSYSWCKSPK